MDGICPAPCPITGGCRSLSIGSLSCHARKVGLKVQPPLRAFVPSTLSTSNSTFCRPQSFPCPGAKLLLGETSYPSPDPVLRNCSHCSHPATESATSSSRS